MLYNIGQDGGIGMNRTVLKIIAIVSMLIDHIGVFLLIEGDLYLAFRLMGRLAFPIFAFMIAQGFLKSRNVNRYVIRLAVFALFIEGLFLVHALLSEVPYIPLKDNVIAPLLLGLLVLICVRSSNDFTRLGLIGILVFTMFVQYPYSIYGLSLIAIFGLISKKWLQAILFLFIHIVFIQIPGINNVLYLYPWQQQFALFFLPLLFLYNGKKGRDYKYLFYLFYPLHLIVLWVIAYFI